MLVLDSLEDPQNVGTLLRSAEAAGVHGVLFPTRRAGPADAVGDQGIGRARSSTCCSRPSTTWPGALADLHVRGLRVVGSDAEAPLTLRQADLRGPLAMVVGSEGRGSGPGDPAPLRPVRADPDARPRSGRSTPRSPGRSCSSRRSRSVIRRRHRRRRARAAGRRRAAGPPVARDDAVAASAGDAAGDAPVGDRMPCRSGEPAAAPASGDAASDGDLAGEAPGRPSLDPSGPPALSSPGAIGSPAGWPCAPT